MKKFKLFILPVLLFVLGIGVLGSVYATPKTTVAPAVEAPVVSQVAPVVEPPATVESLLAAVNAERAKVGAPALVIDERLNQSAQAKADDMRARNYRAHIDPDGKRGVDIAHEYAPDICVTHVGENLVWGETETPQELMTSSAMYSWKNSKKHYEAMIDTGYIYTGFGVNGSIVVEHFCKP